jgi:hypothetical protein
MHLNLPAFAVVALSALPVCRVQATEPGPVQVPPAAQRSVTSITALPAAVLSGLRGLCTPCEFADIGAPWNPTDVRNDLPRRRIVSATLRDSVWTIAYQRGGIAMTWHTAVFALTPSVHLVEGSSCLPAGPAPCNW